MILDLDIIRIMFTAEYGKPFKEIANDIRFNPIVSYTTRPKRDSETEGVEHYFISDEEADNLIANNDILAYTKIGDVRYFTLKDQLQSQNVYIIDPAGIEDLNYRFPEMEKFIIYVTSEYNNRMNRYINRSSECTVADFEKRNSAETEQFSLFERNLKDMPNAHIVSNNSPYFVTTLMSAAKLVIESYKPGLLYCIVGRTSAGKDIITKHLTKLFSYDDEE